MDIFLLSILPQSIRELCDMLYWSFAFASIGWFCFSMLSAHPLRGTKRFYSSLSGMQVEYWKWTIGAWMVCPLLLTLCSISLFTETDPMIIQQKAQNCLTLWLPLPVTTFLYLVVESLNDIRRRNLPLT
jgi:hypothetical protein